MEWLSHVASDLGFNYLPDLLTARQFISGRHDHSLLDVIIGNSSGKIKFADRAERVSSSLNRTRRCDIH